MSTTFVATLGQRPEALTMAFDALSRRYTYEHFVVLHTEPHASGIAQAYADLMAVLGDYDNVTVTPYETAYPDGTPLLDLDSEAACDAYFKAVYNALVALKQQGHTVHLLISGGRKAMSAFAMAAAAQCFGSQDRAWAVLTDERIMAQRGQFHARPGQHDLVKVVRLPITLVNRLNTISPDEALRRATESRRELFMRRLTDAECTLANLLRDHPDASDTELAEMLNKSHRTIENQLSAIYDKMSSFFEDGDRILSRAKRRRLILLLTQE